MYWENYKGVALAKELRELAVILIATRGRQGYPIKDLVTRMQEITGVQLRKTLSRAVASIYDSGWLDVEYQKNGFQVKRVTLNTQKHRDSIVASDQKKMFKDILKVGVKGKGRIQLKDMERETRISYKDCRLFASGERSAFKRDISERYDNHIALSVFLARHISSTEWARDKIADAGITEIKGMENLISILLVIYQDYNTRQIKEESISKKIVGLEFCINTIWLPMYWVNKGTLMGLDKEEIIRGVWGINYREFQYLGCNIHDSSKLVDFMGVNKEKFEDVLSNNGLTPTTALEVRKALKQQGIKDFTKKLSSATGNLFASMWDMTRIMIEKYEKEWKKQEEIALFPELHTLLISDKKRTKQIIKDADEKLFEGFSPTAPYLDKKGDQ